MSTDKSLYGERLTYIPLRDLNAQELAQLYAFLVLKNGENNSLCYEVLDELKNRVDLANESINKHWEDGHDAAMAELGEQYDIGFADGYDSALLEIKKNEDS